ncbi:MAG: GDP-mannose 4,6-dehydratase [Anaerolineales bacterium]|nr:GDP-mannose 4,6-dehydratase [Anaerolineales bacterium]MCA9930268.1 GDP-mannose 4,6-dehydratase [Anaerolineales bacterium]
MRLFITGATGFAGSHLLDLLLAEEHEVYALVHPSSSTQSLPEHPLVHSVEGDLLDLDGLKTAVSNAKPDVIYHLAGQPFPARSWVDPAFTFAVNVGGTANLLQAAVAYGRPRVLVITSAEIYGRIVPEDLPITEDLVPHPRHPYGVSKWAASQLVPIYWERYQLPVVEARPFNHIGPRQALGFVVPDFASQLAAIKLKQQAPVMRVGNLDARRDFTDVRDVVRAYKTLAEYGVPGEGYLICSEQPVSIHYLLAALAELADVRVEIEYDPERMRPSDVPLLYASYRKLNKQTGWQPEIHLRQSLADVLDGWLEQLQMERDDG